MVAIKSEDVKVEVIEEDGKRIVKTTAVEWGYKLTAYICNLFFEPRLAVPEFSIELEEVKSDTQWLQVCSHTATAAGASRT
jgi:hypothetical protein